MAVKTEKELNEAQHSLWLKAMAAVELRNFGYAISLLQGILKQEPQFLTGRQLLRRAEVAKQKSGKKSFFNISTAALAVMKAQREIKQTPQRAVEMIEKVLEEEPYNRHANLTLKEAAVAAGWPEIGVFALRTLLEENPRDVKLLRELGQLYHQTGQNEEEVEIYTRITEIDPLDATALRLGKDASARASMSTGGWTRAESYRELIKDKDAAISLEQQSRMQLTGEALEQQIAELEAQQQAKPQNVDLARRLGALSEQKNDIESASKWYQRAVDLTGGSDAGLIRKVSDLKMRGAEREIAAHEEFLAGHQKKDAVHAKKTEELQAAKKKRAGMLIEEAKKRLERNPTDLQLRFELGEHFVTAQRFREAVPELQRARQNPNARLKAMNLLGVCYRELGMPDLAMKQFEDAAKEITTMDAMKKEIVYNLGTVYEKMGERERSLNCMKQIYEADYGYKDVAERVESSYQQGKGRS
ncbi:MAG TPA: tetratricopeptide repeat protein [Chthoniobacterales bacterium]|jgi:tetratricopeptide (TPR) repeat protein|nr:tetratricopeptide repeat protein [Chthoniobacterales bacterium]